MDGPFTFPDEYVVHAGPLSRAAPRPATACGAHISSLCRRTSIRANRLEIRSRYMGNTAPAPPRVPYNGQARGEGGRVREGPVLRPAGRQAPERVADEDI